MTSVTDPLGGETNYTYDDAGRRLSVSDATGQTTTYGYDGAGQVTRGHGPRRQLDAEHIRPCGGS